MWNALKQSSDAEDPDDPQNQRGCRFLCCGGGKKGQGGVRLANGFFESRAEDEPQPSRLKKLRSRCCSGKALGAYFAMLVAGLASVGLFLWHPWAPTRYPTKDFVKRSSDFARAVEEGRCDFDYPLKSADCFCQLSNHSGCIGEPCACEGGCHAGEKWASPQAVSFKNVGRAGICSETRALLTVPTAYFEHVGMLLQWCPAGARTLLKDLLLGGFRAYQEHVVTAPVKQCVHAPGMISEGWLHVHTICHDGLIDGLQDTDENGWCGVAKNATDMDDQVESLVSWATDLSRAKGRAEATDSRFDRCASTGCGKETKAPAPLCSCAPSCQEGKTVTCCEDFHEVCH